MAKVMPNAAYDILWDAIADDFNEMVLCEGEPADFNDVNADVGSGGKRLGTKTLTVGDGGGDFVIADNDGGGGGRMLTMSQQTGITPSVGGDLDHVALVDTTNSILGPIVTLAATKAVTTDTDVTVNAFALRGKDPV